MNQMDKYFIGQKVVITNGNGSHFSEGDELIVFKVEDNDYTGCYPIFVSEDGTEECQCECPFIDNFKLVDDTEDDMDVILNTVHPLLRRLPYNRSSIVELMLLTLIEPEASEQLLEDALFHVEDELELVRGE